MDRGGNHPSIRISQKRLTLFLAILGAIGSLLLGILWWDSTENITSYTTKGRTTSIGISCIFHEAHSTKSRMNGYHRVKAEIFGLDHQSLFREPSFSPSFVRIPVYLILLTYLATLLLIWLALMNRISRRDFVRQDDGK